MRTLATKSKTSLIAIAAVLVAVVALAFSLPRVSTGSNTKVFTATAEITATYDDAGNISIPDVELTNNTGSDVVLKAAKINSNYSFVSEWTNDAAGKTIAAGETITIKWTANSKVPSSWTKGEKVHVGTVTYTYEAAEAKPIDFSKASLETTEYTYDGTAKKPAVLGLDDLVEGTDYKVEYNNNVNAGTATATVTGIGNYTGSKTFEFTIAKKAITVTWDPNGGTADFEYTYDGKAKTPAATLNGVVGTDALTATLSYKKGSDSIASAPSDAGSYTVTVTSLSGGAASNYALPTAEADRSKSFIINFGTFWFASAKASDPEANAYKTESQIRSDLAKIQADPDGTVAQEYKTLMENDTYHLYTKWSGSTVDSSDKEQAANKYVEFRIIQVGPHDGDGSALTFVATHALPSTERIRATYTTTGGWKDSAMREAMSSYVATGLSNLTSSGLVKAVSKKTAYRASTSDSWEVVDTTDSFWLLSYTEVFGTSGTSSYYKSEGAQYDWFSTASSSAVGSMYLTRNGVKPQFCRSDGSYWWLRSPRVTSSGSFAIVTSDGSPDFNSVTYNYSVAPAFAM